MRTKTCLAVLIACFAAASNAAAQYCEIESISVHSEGDGVSADFSSVDTSTCALGIETSVHVDGGEGIVSIFHTCGSDREVIQDTTEESSVVAVLVGVYDRCLGTQVFSVTGTGEATELHVNQNFKSASLRAAFEGTDGSGQAVSIAVDLVWAGTGDKERVREHVNEGQGGAFSLRYMSSGTIRDAVAAGSVTVNGTDETPLPSNQGTIEKDASRGLEEWR